MRCGRAQFALAIALSVFGCIEIPNVIPGGGEEGRPCLDGECLGELQCMDGVCVDLAEAGTDHRPKSTDGSSSGASPDADDDTTTTALPTGATESAGEVSSTTSEGTTGEPADPSGGLSPAEVCSEDSDCPDPQRCFVMGLLGGTCGECANDADCTTGGCSPPDPFEELGSYCNDGSLGGGCQTPAACQDDLYCALIVDVPGVVVSAACSECRYDSDCSTGYCAPDYDSGVLRGHKRCVGAGSLPLGSGCDLEGSSVACASDVCAEIEVMGLLTIGACGECRSDSDCPGFCESGSLNLENGLVTPSQCV